MQPMPQLTSAHMVVAELTVEADGGHFPGCNNACVHLDIALSGESGLRQVLDLAVLVQEALQREDDTCCNLGRQF